MTRSPTLPQGDHKRTEVTRMFDRIAGRYDRVNRVISLGFDRRWRRRTINSLNLPPTACVLDLACGTGALCIELEAAGYRSIGIDISQGMLTAARIPTPLARADVTCLPVPDGSVSEIVCGFALRNVVDLEAFFDECARVLRSEGRLALLDAAEPTNRWIRAGHHLWFHRLVPWLGARLSDAEAYRYLPDSLQYLPAPEKLLRLVSDRGFHSVTRITMMGGSIALITGTRR